MSNRPLKIAVIASEAVPFAKTGGLADVTGAMARELALAGHEVILLLPAHQGIDRLGYGLKPARHACVPKRTMACRHGGRPFVIKLGTDEHPVAVLDSFFVPGLRSCFIDHPLFSDRPGLYGDARGDYPDNGLRYGLFSKAALELLTIEGFAPDIVHCHDWQTGLAPVYLKQDEHFAQTRSVFTVHNLAYQGIFGKEILAALGLPNALFHLDGLEYYGQINFLKGGLFFADRITTVSPSYAKQILTPGYGCGLDGALRAREDRLSGILNGVDYAEWDPSRDQYLARFDRSRLHLKEGAKRILCQRLGLEYRNRRALVGIVSRLAMQKGWDIISEALPRLLQMELDLAILGAGDQAYHDLLHDLQKRHPRRIGLKLGFDNELAHLIYGGADLFLMPSQYEPCGLGQMIALRYGAIPVVHATGGLADTIVDHRQLPDSSNGFSFSEYSADSLVKAIRDALSAYRVIPAWQALMKRAMACDFSWTTSIAKYLDLYRSLLER
ncbi:MAG: glycogen synthase GlgA, partial [Candidatus Edwardsbacteria bacterium]|nr:glycogen synthase GlgA [Candidatus Edwardsbacteria bacterium]